jgi:hypothetical protein
MVGLQTLNLAIGVRVPASQPKNFLTAVTSKQQQHLRSPEKTTEPLKGTKGAEAMTRNLVVLPRLLRDRRECCPRL